LDKFIYFKVEPLNKHNES